MCLLVMQGTMIFEFGLTKHKLYTFWSMNLGCFALPLFRMLNFYECMAISS